MQHGADYRGGKPWTTEEDELLCKLAAAGRSKAEITTILKRSLSGVASRAGALHVPLTRPPVSWGKPFSADEDQRLRELLAAGMRRYTCARIMQRSAETLIKRAAELGTPFPPIDGGTVWATCLDAAKAEWIAGASGGDIARRHGGGLTRSAVIAKMHRLGLGNIPGRYKPRKAKPKTAKQLRPRKPRPVVPKVRHERPALFAWSYKRLAGALEPLRPKVRAGDVARVCHDDLKSRHCRWPVGNVRRAIAQHQPSFCGKRREPGLPYCAEHVACAYRAIALVPRHFYPTGEKGGAASAKSSA